MWLFLIPLFIDNNGCLRIAIPHVNHTVLSPKIVSEICNDKCGNHLGVKNENKGGNDVSCLLVYYNKVCYSDVN